MAAIVAMKQGQETRDFDKEKFEKTYGLKLDELQISRDKINKEGDREIRERYGREADALIAEHGSPDNMPPEILSEYERKMKISLGQGFKTKQEAKVEALKAVSKFADPEEIGMKKFNELVEAWASSIYYGTVVEKAEGGRISKQMGGGFDMTQAPQAVSQEPQMMQPQKDPYMILREKLPPEIPNEVVQLIAYNKEAFEDFANIQTQDDVDLFNQKYNVQLVVDMASA